MLIWFVVLYLLVSIGIGLYAATRVHSARDFAIAGRHLPLPIVTATVFATWFGAETVLGISATFVKEGDAAVGKRLDEMKLDELNVEVNAVRRHNVEGSQPSGDMVLRAGDVLMLLGQPVTLEAAEKRLHEG